MRQPEAIIQNQIMGYLKFRGIFAWQNKSSGTYDQKLRRFRTPGPWFMRGTADIMGCLDDGTILCIEVKTKTGKLSLVQKIFGEEIKLRGGFYLVARSVSDVELALNSYLGGHSEGDISSAKLGQATST